MVNRVSKKKQYTLNILDNTFYSRLLILIDKGHSTYDKIIKIRKRMEGIKYPPSNSNVQFKRLLDSNYITEDGIKRKYNKKNYEVNWPKLLIEFKNYAHQRYEYSKKDIWWEMPEEIENNLSFTYPQITPELKKPIIDLAKKAEKGPKIREELNRFSDEFNLFLKKVIRGSFNLGYSQLNQHSLSYYFDKVINGFATSLFNILIEGYRTRIMFIPNSKLGKEIFRFALICKDIYHPPSYINIYSEMVPYFNRTSLGKVMSISPNIYKFRWGDTKETRKKNKH